MTKWTVRRVAGSLLAATTAVAAGGCGISATPPQPIADGLVGGLGLGSDTQISAPGPEPGTPSQTVSRYFEAAAGGGEAAVKNVQSFLSANARAKWVSGQQLTIVRILRIDPEGARTGRTITVTGRYQRVGVLTDQGVVDDVNDQPQVNFTFTLVAVGEGSSQWEIDSGPPGMLLSDTALAHYYRDRPIYFWDTNRQRLVPDLRYLSLTTAPATRPNTIVDWLLNGPSRWLSPAVVRIAAGAERKSGVVPQDGALVVNLTAPAGAGPPEEVQRLVDQLRWSLRTDGFPAIELQIEGQPKAVDNTPERYLAANAAASIKATAERFGVADGRVVPLPVGSAKNALGVLASSANRNVISAAVTHEPDRVAFVRRLSNGNVYLSIQRAGESGLPRPVEVNLGRPASVSRPAWIPGATDRLLIAVGGRIYVVTGAGGPSEITPDGVSDVTALSVAPDGRRIAFVSDGRAYVAALVVAGSAVSVDNQRRPLVPGQIDAAAVAWTSEDRVLVAGSANGRAALWRVRADGTVAEDTSPNEVALTDVVAYPQSPIRPTSSVEAMVQTAAVAYNLYGRTLSAEPGALWPCYAL